ncbi:uncharacterized protein LOC141707992 [Apium graveolens]|uniref:uncharacterized protein LOC141707992 n=1 Tax=Apium graveolens TaxID=4045 RepID=UPI003D7B8CFB
MKRLLTMNVYTSSSLCSRRTLMLIKPFRACFQNIIIQGYSNYNGGEESTINKPTDGHENQVRLPRAPSTAEQFERVAQEKANYERVVQDKAKHGVVSQTVDKAEDALEDATIGDSSDFEFIKETYKQPFGKATSHNTDHV